MGRENYLNTDERRRPYWVRLERIDNGRHVLLDEAPPALVLLDLRGLEFSRPTERRLAATFDRLIRGFNIRKHEIEDFCLSITPLTWEQDEQVLGEHITYTPGDRAELRKRAFQWIPVPDDDKHKEYAWQR